MSKRDDIALERSRKRGFGEAATDVSGVVARIRAARKLRRTIRWPNTDIEIGLKVLSQAEVDEAHAAARVAIASAGIDMRKLADDLVQVDTVGAAVTVQLLARALYETAAGDAPRLYSTADEFAADVTAAELSELLSEYGALENDVGTLGELTDEAFEEFVRAAKKKDATSLNSIAGAMPLRWLRSMAVRLATLPNSNSSTPSSLTSPSEE
jgi:hypothetical protein